MRSISFDDWWTVDLFAIILELFIVDLFRPHHNHHVDLFIVDLFTVDRWMLSMSQAFLRILTMLRWVPRRLLLHQVTKYINGLSLYNCDALITTMSSGLSTFFNHRPSSALSTSLLCRFVDPYAMSICQPLCYVDLSIFVLCRSFNRPFLIYWPSSLSLTFVEFPCISFDVFLARSSISFDLSLVKSSISFDLFLSSSLTCSSSTYSSSYTNHTLYQWQLKLLQSPSLTSMTTIFNISKLTTNKV